MESSFVESHHINTPVNSRAVATIVSRNYIPAARVLAKSFLKHHPDSRVYVLLVDDLKGIEQDGESFQLVTLDDLGIPDLHRFLYQYSILEANTAVKPFLLRHLFSKYGMDTLLYLDPDIMVYGSLDAIWEALRDHSILLIPHIRKPFYDHAQPSELSILQAGTFNLGCIGLRKSPTASTLLDWWSSKTEFDCVVEPEAGHFVDQRWMDMAPCYFSDTYILRKPEYNVAYWNLHERVLKEGKQGYEVDGTPLKFFHFSGYNPTRQHILSKHQNRHDLRLLNPLKKMCEEYAIRLQAEGYAAFCNIAYAFDRLPNGIPVMAEMRRVVRNCRKMSIPIPSPWEEPEEFCRFVATPNPVVCEGRDLAPIVDALLKTRLDAMVEYPKGLSDACDPDFLRWYKNYCYYEKKFHQFYEKYGHLLKQKNIFTRIKECYARRPDARQAHPYAFSPGQGLDRFLQWLLRYGTIEEGFTEQEIHDFYAASFVDSQRLLDIYFSRPDIQELFPFALAGGHQKEFLSWMWKEGCRNSELTPLEACWLQEHAIQEAQQNLLFTGLYNSWIRSQVPLGPSTFGWRTLLSWSETEIGPLSKDSPALLPRGLSSLAQLELRVASSPELSSRFPQAFNDASVLSQLVSHVMEEPWRCSWIDRLTHSDFLNGLSKELRGYQPQSSAVNIAGYFRFVAGMGEASHSLHAAIKAACIPVAEVCLPAVNSGTCGIAPPGPSHSLPFGWHNLQYRTNVVVANADMMPRVRAHLGPAFFHDRRNIAYWVWETDKLPDVYRESAEGLAEIWAPSVHTAEAIRRTVNVPVQVVPYSLRITKPATSQRPPQIPEDKTVFGFFFDTRSILERKNPQAVIDAFRKAFRRDDSVALVLKVLRNQNSDSTLRRLQQQMNGLPVIWIDKPLSRQEIINLMASIDVYVSLHRSEGFGLTIAEAMALMKPVIATGYSGNMDFMSEDCSQLVRHQIIETDQDYAPYPAGTRWAEPDIEHAAELMRELYLHPDFGKELGTKAQQRVQQLLSPVVVGRHVKTLLEPESKPGSQS